MTKLTRVLEYFLEVWGHQKVPLQVFDRLMRLSKFQKYGNTIFHKHKDRA